MIDIEDMTQRISPRQFHEADGVEDWRVLGEGACTYFRLPVMGFQTFATARRRSSGWACVPRS